MSWAKYQEKVAKVFTKLALNAKTNRKVKGIRATHSLDVLVTFRHLGLDQIWVVECKYWKTRVPKEKVAAFQTVLNDIGAHRGFIISEVGFQSGARKLALRTNIDLLTYKELIAIVEADIIKLAFDSLELRMKNLYQRFHAAYFPEDEPFFSKKRPGVDENGYDKWGGKVGCLRRAIERYRDGDKFPYVIDFRNRRGQEILEWVRSLPELLKIVPKKMDIFERWLKRQERAIKKIKKGKRTISRG